VREATADDRSEPLGQVWPAIERAHIELLLAEPSFDDGMAPVTASNKTTPSDQMQQPAKSDSDHSSTSASKDAEHADADRLRRDLRRRAELVEQHLEILTGCWQARGELADVPLRRRIPRIEPEQPHPLGLLLFLEVSRGESPDGGRSMFPTTLTKPFRR
jgi:hypothetical protein